MRGKGLHIVGFISWLAGLVTLALGVVKLNYANLSGIELVLLAIAMFILTIASILIFSIEPNIEEIKNNQNQA